MIEVNKKFLVLAVVLMAVAMLATPVMADSPKKIPVTITRDGWWFIPPPEVWISGNVQHGRGFTGGFAYYNMEGEGISLTGSISSIGNYNINLENGHGAVQRKIVIVFDGGTFEGHNNQRGIFFIPPGGPFAGFPALIDGTAHAVFQGTGDYHGWTFVFTKEPDQPFEAYMLIP